MECVIASVRVPLSLPCTVQTFGCGKEAHEVSWRGENLLWCVTRRLYPIRQRVKFNLHEYFAEILFGAQKYSKLIFSELHLLHITIIVLAKPLVSHILKKFPAYYRFRRQDTVHTRASHLSISLSQMNSFGHSFTADTNVLPAQLVDRTDTTLLKLKVLIRKDNQQ
jgi:hypothetical protein